VALDRKESHGRVRRGLGATRRSGGAVSARRSRDRSTRGPNRDVASVNGLDGSGRRALSSGVVGGIRSRVATAPRGNGNERDVRDPATSSDRVRHGLRMTDLHRGLAVRLSALETEIVRIARVSEASWSGPAADRFRQQLERRRRLVADVRRQLLTVPVP
jgi:hypothetical protein